ncbi:MAG: ECF transporter S component [Defluviitaleaceae bacterium]|nr:ECF transporter S component [Defluviitaleaceae bacterium]
MEKNFENHQKKGRKNNLFDVKTLVILAMLTAIAFLLAAFVRFPVLPGPVPLRFDPKDVVIVIGGYMFGPLAAFIVTVVVSLLQFFITSTTGWIGLVMNIISGTAFAVTAAFIYSKRRTLNGAVIGLVVATIAMTAVMMLWNLIMVPLFTPGVTREFVMGLLIPFFMPFNLFSGIVNSTLIMLLYKPLVGALKASNLMPSPDANKKVNPTGVVVILSFFALISAGLWTMSMQEIGPFAPSPLVVQGEGVGGNHRSFPTHVTLNPVLDGLGLPRPATDAQTGLRNIEGFIGTAGFRFGSNRVYLNGEPITLSQPVMRVDGVTYMPIEFFILLLGVDNAYYEDGQIMIYNNTN